MLLLTQRRERESWYSSSLSSRSRAASWCGRKILLSAHQSWFELLDVDTSQPSQYAFNIWHIWRITVDKLPRSTKAKAARSGDVFRRCEPTWLRRVETHVHCTPLHCCRGVRTAERPGSLLPRALHTRTLKEKTCTGERLSYTHGASKLMQAARKLKNTINMTEISFSTASAAEPVSSTQHHPNQSSSSSPYSPPHPTLQPR